MAAKRPRGRPPKLDEQVTEAICRVVLRGGYLEAAAAVEGIHVATLYRWLARGNPEGTDRRDAPYRAFRERVEQARGNAETRNVVVIAQAAQAGNWQAAAWLLERQHPERWARPAPRELERVEPPAPEEDPFAEVDELAARRANR